MAIDLKELKFYVNYTGKKLKTDGLTLNQNSSNNVIDFICMDQYDVVEIYFKNPAGQISPKYHMINNGIYQKSTDDLEVSEIADNTFHEWKFAIPYAITSFTMTSSTARMEVSFAGYKYDAGNKLVISSTANTQIVVNKSNTSDSLDESYNGTDVENLWKAIGTISEGKQDKLPTVINGRYLHTNENTGELEWSIVQSGGGQGREYGAGDGIIISEDTISVDPTFVATKEYVDLTKQDKLIAGANITIGPDGKTISASTGANYTAGTGILINGNVIEVAQSEINYNNLTGKPTIGNGTLTIQKNGSTLGSFNANATTGKTIDIPVPTKTSDLSNDSGYVTNAYHDATKQDVLTAGAGINITNNVISADATGIEIVSVASLPTASSSTYGKIYLVPSATAETDNIKDEYITIRTGSSSSYSYSWELIGNTSVDLSNYYTKSEVNAMDTATRALIPTNTNQLTNGANFQNATQVSSAIASGITGKQDTLSAGSNIQIVGNTISATDTTYNATQGIEQTGTTFKLRSDFYNYLIANAYLYPQIETFQLIDGNDSVINTSQTTGDTVTIVKVRHGESNLGNIQGTLTLKQDGVNIATGITPNAYDEITLSSPITISSNSTFSLSGTNTMGQTFSSAVSIQFNAAVETLRAYGAVLYGNGTEYYHTPVTDPFTLVNAPGSLSDNHFELNIIPNTKPLIFVVGQDGGGNGIGLLEWDPINYIWIWADWQSTPTYHQTTDPETGDPIYYWAYTCDDVFEGTMTAKLTVGRVS